MNLKKLFLKLAVLTMGIVALYQAAVPAKALVTLHCQFARFCETSTSAGTCGYGPEADCRVCYGYDGSVGSCL